MTRNHSAPRFRPRRAACALAMLILLLSLLSVSGCGLKGDLYIPDHPVETAIAGDEDEPDATVEETEQ